MVKHGIKGAVGGGAATMEAGPISAYRDAAARAGKDLKLGEDLMIGLVIHLAESKERAMREIVPLYEEHAKMFAPLNFMPGMTKEQVATVSQRGGWYEAGVPRVEHYMKSGAWFAGTPQELVAHLRSLEERFPGLETVSLSMPMGTPEAIMLEQYRIVGEAVIPAFNGHR
jgi:alkanesulfonate monooxygenase SsuD/methylene tetrahydromethanopterin reductase-like flavin-dependent oxidoreductase (luciferase family)